MYIFIYYVGYMVGMVSFYQIISTGATAYYHEILEKGKVAVLYLESLFTGIKR